MTCNNTNEYTDLNGLGGEVELNTDSVSGREGHWKDEAQNVSKRNWLRELLPP